MIFLVVLLCVAAALALVVGDRRYRTKATYSEFLAQVKAGEVAKAMIAVAETGANSIDYILRNGTRLQTIVPSDYKDALAAMTANRVAVEIREASSQWWQILLNMTPFLLLLGFWFLMFRQLRNKPGPPPRPA